MSWISANWFSLLQTLGIVGGLLFNAHSLRLNSKIRKVETLLNITQQHRALWLKFIDSPPLKRIVSPNPDLKKHPMTDDETLFVNLLILHITAVMTAVHQGVFPKPAGLDIDTREFFSLPIPHAVWQQTKNFRDPETIRYVESLLPDKPVLSPEI